MATTATAVSRALTAGGETKSVFTRSGMVRGYGTSSRGFVAENDYTWGSKQDYRRLRGGKGAGWGYVTVPKKDFTGAVWVEFTPGSWGTEDAAERDARLASYVAILTAKGFTTEIKTDPTSKRVRLYVTKEA
jgi:hypothetical protein